MRNNSSEVIHESMVATTVSVSTPLQLLAACILGAVIVYAAGFINTTAVHNAAHDTRHSQGFPCH